MSATRLLQASLRQSVHARQLLLIQDFDHPPSSSSLNSTAAPNYHPNVRRCASTCVLGSVRGRTPGPGPPAPLPLLGPLLGGPPGARLCRGGGGGGSTGRLPEPLRGGGPRILPRRGGPRIPPLPPPQPLPPSTLWPLIHTCPLILTNSLYPPQPGFLPPSTRRPLIQTPLPGPPPPKAAIMFCSNRSIPRSHWFMVCSNCPIMFTKLFMLFMVDGIARRIWVGICVSLG